MTPKEQILQDAQRRYNDCYSGPHLAGLGFAPMAEDAQRYIVAALLDYLNQPAPALTEPAAPRATEVDEVTNRRFYQQVCDEVQEAFCRVHPAVHFATYPEGIARLAAARNAAVVEVDQLRDEVRRRNQQLLELGLQLEAEARPPLDRSLVNVILNNHFGDAKNATLHAAADAILALATPPALSFSDLARCESACRMLASECRSDSASREGWLDLAARVERFRFGL